MKMKLLLLAGIFLWSFSLFAQDGKLSEEKRKEFDAQKAAYFTQVLDLTPEESAAFWPLYNEMSKKLREQERAMGKAMSEANKTPELTDKQALEVIKTIQSCGQNLLDIKKDYYEKMMKVIPVRKVGKLDGVERRFHKQLFEKLKKSHR